MTICSSEVTTFLTSRRARITPHHAGVVAQLAGVSTDYYARMERGDLGGTSEEVLDAITDAPAFVRTGSRDVLAANALGRALYSPLYESAALAGHRLPSTVRFAFIDPRARDLFADWERTADDAVAALRGGAGRTPYDRILTDLVGELATRSEAFRTRWASHDVRHQAPAPPRRR